LFQPPLSQGLHWYSVYIYSKSIPHKLEQNQAQKLRFIFLTLREIVLRFCQIVLRFFTNESANSAPENRAPISQIGLRFWQLQQSSISPILSHFHNKYLISLLYLINRDDLIIHRWNLSIYNVSSCFGRINMKVTW